MLENYLNGFLSYFVIVDPVGVALIFGSMTAGRSGVWRTRMAWRSVVISIGLVLFFGFFGASLLQKLGIAIESFRIAGGLLLFYTSFKMVTQPEQNEIANDKPIEEDISVFPLSIPLLSGPGCLTLTILLFADAHQDAALLPPLLLAVGSVYILTLICLLASANVTKVVGKTGNAILKRLLGVLLASLSIQFIVDGIRGFLSG